MGMEFPYTSIDIAKIKTAMSYWKEFTCIQFVERNPTEHEDFIIFNKKIM